MKKSYVYRAAALGLVGLGVLSMGTGSAHACEEHTRGQMGPTAQSTAEGDGAGTGNSLADPISAPINLCDNSIAGGALIGLGGAVSECEVAPTPPSPGPVAQSSTATSECNIGTPPTTPPTTSPTMPPTTPPTTPAPTQPPAPPSGEPGPHMAAGDHRAADADDDRGRLADTGGSQGVLLVAGLSLLAAGVGFMTVSGRLRSRFLR